MDFEVVKHTGDDCIQFSDFKYLVAWSISFRWNWQIIIIVFFSCCMGNHHINCYELCFFFQKLPPLNAEVSSLHHVNQSIMLWKLWCVETRFRFLWLCLWIFEGYLYFVFILGLFPLTSIFEPYAPWLSKGCHPPKSMIYISCFNWDKHTKVTRHTDYSPQSMVTWWP
jgi:hypothetical protein